MTKPHITLVGFALVGWAICGATIGIGRQILTMQATLILHALVAPVAFWLLGWGYARWFPAIPARRTSGTMLGIVVALDALLVAPFIEGSYAMFASWLGTWLPFALIAVAAHSGARRGQRRAGGGAAVKAAVETAGPATGTS